mmetsp:Transcript_11831/g.25905  ORF Transcript_11831/g.25905 Transcript_11831/m.25905 type:complete len:235 (-) Transcript_11831:183-887(-)
MNSSTPRYRLVYTVVSMRKRMMHSMDTISSSTISRLVNCSKKSSHSGTLGGGGSTFGPNSSSNSLAFAVLRPWLFSALEKSMCVWKWSDSTSRGYMCSQNAPTPLPPCLSRASSAPSMGVVIVRWMGRMEGREDRLRRRFTAIIRSEEVVCRSIRRPPFSPLMRLVREPERRALMERLTLDPRWAYPGPTSMRITSSEPRREPGVRGEMGDLGETGRDGFEELRDTRPSISTLP